jgi:hypothetical protein
MINKKDVAVFTWKVVSGGAKGGGKLTYQGVKFTVRKTQERQTKKRLELLERTRKMIIMTLDGLHDSTMTSDQKQQARKVVSQNEKALFRMIATLNHGGFDIRYRGNGVLEYLDTDTTD